MKALTDRNGGQCFVDPRGVIAVQADVYNPDLTFIYLVSGQNISVSGFAREVHDALFNDIPMGPRTPAPPSSPG